MYNSIGFVMTRKCQTRIELEQCRINEANLVVKIAELEQLACKKQRFNPRFTPRLFRITKNASYRETNNSVTTSVSLK